MEEDIQLESNGDVSPSKKYEKDTISKGAISLEDEQYYAPLIEHLKGELSDKILCSLDYQQFQNQLLGILQQTLSKKVARLN